MKRSIPGMVLLLLVSLSLLAGEVGAEAQTDQNNRITRGPFRRVLFLNGALISPTSEKFLVPRTNSWEVKLESMIPEGSQVNAGDVVVRFDNSTLVNENLDKLDQLDGKEDELVLKKAEWGEALLDANLRIREAQILLEKAAIDAGVPAELQEMRKYQEAQLAKTKAEENVKKAEKELVTLKANQQGLMEILLLEIDGLRKQIQRNEQLIEAMGLVARTSGIAVYEEHPWEGRLIQIGDSVQPGWSVMRIPDPENMQVEVWAGETDLGLIKPGQNTEFYLDAYPQQKFSGQVVSASNRGIVKEEYGTAPWFKIILTLNEVDFQIMKPGMSVRAEILVQEEDSVLLAPIQFARSTGDGFLIHPQGREPLQVAILGFNSFYSPCP